MVVAMASSVSAQTGDPFTRAADYAAEQSLENIPRFDWGEGVLMYGLEVAYRVTGDPLYRRAVDEWAEYHLRQGIGETLAARDYCGHWGPGTPVLLRYERTRRPGYLDLGREIREFIAAEATRTPEGALGHFRGNDQIWVDTLCMVCPTLAKYYQLTGDEDALDDAVLQLLLAAGHQRDLRSGLFYHMWDDSEDAHSPELWGRGNGWVIISLVDTIEVMDPDDPRRARLARILRDQIEGLLPLQTESGMWRTVLDREDSYEETSATAMITYGIAKAWELGVVGDEVLPPLDAAWAALEDQVSPEGVVLGVSGGTGPGGFENYITRPQGEYPWGTGAFLMAGAKLHELGLIDIPAVGRRDAHGPRR
jgi:unsaturated rhamnogalacturonyl hydrolase